MPIPRKYRPGQKKLSAGQLNDQMDAVQALASMQVTGGATFQREGGSYTLNINEPIPDFWARLDEESTDEPGKYAWTEIEELEDGTFGELEDGRVGLLPENPLIEANLTTGLPVGDLGLIVRATGGFAKLEGGVVVDQYKFVAAAAKTATVFKITGAASSGFYPWSKQVWNGGAWVDSDPAETGTDLRETNDTEIPVDKLVKVERTGGDSPIWVCQYEVSEEVTYEAGCHVTIEEVDEETKKIGVDVDSLVGDNTLSSLVSHEAVSPGVCPFAAVDLEPVTPDYTAEFDKITGFGMVAGKLRLSYERREVLVQKNAAGLPVEVAFGSVTSGYYEVDLCAVAACCDAEPLAAECTRSPSSGTVDETEFSFTVTPAGGVPPYEYYWDFDDGNIAVTQNPTHTYAETGNFSPSVTVTDACGNTVTCSPGPIEVTGAVETDCCPDDTIPTTLVANFSDGTGDLACLEGAAITLTWNGTNWINEDTGVSCGGCSTSLQVLAVQCGNVLGIPTWKLQFNGFDSPSSADCDSCDPFGIRWNLNLNNGACVGTVTCIIGTDPGDCTPPFECNGCSTTDPVPFNMTFSGCDGRYAPLNGTTITFSYDAVVSAAEGVTIWSATVVAPVDGSHKLCLSCNPGAGDPFNVYKLNYPSYGNWDNGAGTCTPFCYRIVGIYWYSGGPTDGMAYLYTSPEDTCS